MLCNREGVLNSTSICYNPETEVSQYNPATCCVPAFIAAGRFIHLFLALRSKASYWGGGVFGVNRKCSPAGKLHVAIQ